MDLSATILYLVDCLWHHGQGWHVWHKYRLHHELNGKELHFKQLKFKTKKYFCSINLMELPPEVYMWKYLHHFTHFQATLHFIWGSLWSASSSAEHPALTAVLHFTMVLGCLFRLTQGHTDRQELNVQDTLLCHGWMSSSVLFFASGVCQVCSRKAMQISPRTKTRLCMPPNWLINTHNVDFSQFVHSWLNGSATDVTLLVQ